MHAYVRMWTLKAQAALSRAPSKLHARLCGRVGVGRRGHEGHEGSVLVTACFLGGWPAGYETTANALAFAIHSIAANPCVEAKMLAEIDAFGRER